MIQAEISAYDLPDGSRIERCKQFNGTYKWAVRKFGGCMNHKGGVELEPQLSNRSNEFLARCRFDSAEKAYETWVLAQAQSKLSEADVNHLRGLVELMAREAGLTPEEFIAATLKQAEAAPEHVRTVVNALNNTMQAQPKPGVSTNKLR